MALYAESEEEDVWGAITQDIVRIVRSVADDDKVAAVAARVLFDNDLSDCVWQRYLNHFVARLYPMSGQSEPCLQHQVIAAWLSSHEGVANSECKVASLHAVAQWHDKLLVSLASSVQPLGQLTMDWEVNESLLTIIRDDENVHSLLTTEIVNAFYLLMSELLHPGVPMTTVHSWAQAFSSTKLGDAVNTAHGPERHRIRVMAIVAILARFGAQDGDVAEFKSIVCCLGASVSEEEDVLSISRIWQALRDTTGAECTQSAFVTPLVIHRLLDMLCSVDLPRADIEFICSTALQCELSYPGTAKAAEAVGSHCLSSKRKRRGDWGGGENLNEEDDTNTSKKRKQERNEKITQMTSAAPVMLRRSLIQHDGVTEVKFQATKRERGHKEKKGSAADDNGHSKKKKKKRSVAKNTEGVCLNVANGSSSSSSSGMQVFGAVHSNNIWDHCSVSNSLPTLESLLVGNTWVTLFPLLKSLAEEGGSLVTLLDSLGSGHRHGVVDIFEESLKVGAASLPYVPMWLQSMEGTLRSDSNYAMDAFFLFMWKWLILVHGSDDLKSLISLAQDLMKTATLASIPQQRAIAIAAVQTLIIHKLAERVVQFADAPLFSDVNEEDRLLGVLELIDMSHWAHELAVSVCFELSCDMDQALQQMRRCASACEDDGCRIMGSWLRVAMEAIEADPPQWLADIKALRPPLVVVPLISLFDVHSCPDSFVNALVVMREKLRCLWVIPDIIEFYKWVTYELSNTPMVEALVKKLTVDNLMENARKTKDGTHYRRMWVRVKVGVNRWMQSCDRATHMIDESLPVWSILSTRNPDFELRQNCLMNILQDLLDIYTKFLTASGVDVKCLVAVDESRQLDTVADVYCLGLQDSLQQDHLGLHEQGQHLDEALAVWTRGLDHVGMLSVSLGRSFEWDHLSADVEEIKMSLPALPVNVKEYQKSCRFLESSVLKTGTQQTYHFQIYHSLDYDSLVSLISALRHIQDLHPNASNEQLLRCTYIDLPDEEQGSTLLSTPITELSKLNEFLNVQIETQAYLFAHKGIALKQFWPEDIQVALQHLESNYDCLIDDARNLEAHLVKHELLIKPAEPLHTSLARAFQSESALLKQVPLLRMLKEVGSQRQFQFIGAHYVCLRQKLRCWATSLLKAPLKLWDWSFFHTDNDHSVETVQLDGNLKGRLTPWFLLDPPEIEAQKREELEKNNLYTIQQHAAGCIQKFLRTMSRRLRVHVAIPAGDVAEAASRGKKRSRGSASQGRGRGRGRGHSRRDRACDGPSLGDLLLVDVQKREEKESAQQTAVQNLEILCSDPIVTEALLQNLVEAVEEARKAGIPEESGGVVATAMAKISLAQQRWTDAKDSLREALRVQPPDEEKLGQAVKKARLAGLRQDTSEVEAAVRLHKDVKNAKDHLSKSLSRSYLPPSELRKAVETCTYFDIPLSEKDIQAKDYFEKEELNFTKECARRWGDSVASKVQRSCEDWHQSPPSRLLMPADDFLKKTFESAFEKLKYSEIPGAMRKDIDTAIQLLEKPVMEKWLHVGVYLAFAHTSPSHVDLYRADAEDIIAEYLKDTVLVNTFPVVFLLAAVRLSSDNDTVFRNSCLRRCNFPHILQLMTTQELQLVDTPPTHVSERTRGVTKSVAKTSVSEWNRLKKEKDSIPSPALDKLMALAGLEMVKEKALGIYESILAEQSLPVERRVPQSFNFALLGNPGTGKSISTPCCLINYC